MPGGIGLVQDFCWWYSECLSIFKNCRAQHHISLNFSDSGLVRSEWYPPYPPTNTNIIFQCISCISHKKTLWNDFSPKKSGLFRSVAEVLMLKIRKTAFRIWGKAGHEGTGDDWDLPYFKKPPCVVLRCTFCIFWTCYTCLMGRKKRNQWSTSCFFFRGVLNASLPKPRTGWRSIHTMRCPHGPDPVRTRSGVRTVRGCSTPMHVLRWRSFRSTPSEVPRYSGQICGQKNLKSAVETREPSQFEGERQCWSPKNGWKCQGPNLCFEAFCRHFELNKIRFYRHSL